MAFYYQPFSPYDLPFAPPRRRPNRSYFTRGSPLLNDDLLNLFIPFVVEAQPSREKQKIKPRSVGDPPAKWAECVQMPGFSPNEVAAEVKDDKVVIIGKRVTGDGDNADTIEMKRTVAIPPDVDASKVVCNFVPRRFVLVEGPRSKLASREVPVFNNNDLTEKKQEAAAAATPSGDAAADQKAEGEATTAKKIGEEESDDEGEDDAMVNVLKPGDNPPPSQPEDAELKPANFELMINLKNFKPSDIMVSRNDRRLIIDATRQEESEYCAGTETFHREVELPENADPSRLRCFFREDGVMMVSAPFTQDSDIVIPVTFEGAEEGESEGKDEGKEEEKKEEPQEPEN